MGSKVIICFDIDSKKSFMSGQIYMALSEVTSLAGLFLIGNYKKAVFKVNISAANEYDRLKVERTVS